MADKTRDQVTLDVVGRRIDASTNAHTEYLEELRIAGKLDSGEAESLRAFEGFLTWVLERFDSLSSPTPALSASQKHVSQTHSQLLLTDFYADIGEVVRYREASTYDGTMPRTPEAQWRTLVAGLLAAEVEINGKFQMRRGATSEIAAILRTLGEGFRLSNLPLHAAYAFDRAADQYHILRNNRAESRCLYEEKRAKHAARPSGARKGFDYCLDQLYGYGYKPFRIVKVIVAQLALYSLFVWWATPDEVDPVRAMESVLLDYLNPTGPEQLMRGAGNALLAADSYTGYITLTIFFALLVRHWWP